MNENVTAEDIRVVGGWNPEAAKEQTGGMLPLVCLRFAMDKNRDMHLDVWRAMYELNTEVAERMVPPEPGCPAHTFFEFCVLAELTRGLVIKHGDNASAYKPFQSSNATAWNTTIEAVVAAFVSRFRTLEQSDLLTFFQTNVSELEAEIVAKLATLPT